MEQEKTEHFNLPDDSDGNAKRAKRLDILFQDIFQSGKNNYFNRRDLVENGYEGTCHYAAMEPVTLYVVTKVSRDRVRAHVWQSILASATNAPLLGID